MIGKKILKKKTVFSKSFNFSLKLYRLSQCRVFVVDDDQVIKLSQLTPYELNLRKRRNIMVSSAGFCSVRLMMMCETESENLDVKYVKNI